MAAEHTESIKVLLPSNEADFLQGFGEGVWFLVTKEVKAAYDADEVDTTYWGILDNDPYNWAELKHGAKLPFEMRGEQRPVVLYDFLKAHYIPLEG